MWAGAHKTRTENDICFAAQDRLEQARVFLRIIFEVGVLDENDITGSGCETTAQGRALATINAVVNDAIGNWLDIAFQDRAAAVSRTIIYDDDLDVPERGGPDRRHDFANSIAFVITGDNDGDFHGPLLTEQESRRAGAPAAK